MFRVSKLKDRLNYLKALMDSDLFIVGGGGLFSELRSIVLNFYCFQIALAGLLNKKILILDVGVGPLRTEQGKKTLKRVFNKYPDLITVRDEQSKENLLSCGVTKEIHVIPDPAFSYPYEGKQHDNSDRVILNCYPTFNSDLIWPGQTHRYHKLVESLEQTIQYLIEHHELKVDLLPFGTESDLNFAKELCAKVGNPNLSVLEFNNYKDIAKSLESCSFSITMRFHAGLLSFIAGRPSICIDQQYKSERVLEHMGLTDLLVSIPDGVHKPGNQDIEMDDMKKKIDRVIENNQSYRKQIDEYVMARQDELKSAYKLIKDFINESTL
jgi:polysaccharide pyruvyl transferase WcaK-like protein